MSQLDFTVIRGDHFERLSFVTWPEVIEDPGTYTGRLVFREAQDDDAADLHICTSPVEIVDDPRFGGDIALFTWTMTPAETQALPQVDIVAYAEVTDGADYVRRAYDSKVKIRD